jgi:phage baseplate assembly protein V
MSVLRSGYIDQVGDANIADELDRYVVRLGQDELETGWLPLLKMDVRLTNIDYVLDIDTPVMVLFEDNELRKGVILGAINTAKYNQKSTNKDIVLTTYADGSTIAYNSKAHSYDIKLHTDAKATITCQQATIKAAKGVTIDGKLTVTGDIDISGSATATDFTAGIISLTKHKHNSTAPGSPTSPPIS